MNDKHKNTLRMAADALKVGRVDARLANSLLGIISSAARATPAQSDQVSVPHERLQNWIDVIHDNERSLGDRLQSLSSTFAGLLNGDAVDKYPLREIREQQQDTEQQREMRRQESEEAARLQTLLVERFNDFRQPYPEGLMGWARAALAATSSPSSVGDAIRAMPLPEPLEIYWPQLNSNALGCGVEDRNIRDRYEAAEYGWQDGVDKAAERVPEDIYTADQVRELLSEAAAIAEQVQGQLVPDGWALVPCKMTDEQAREVVYNINRKYKGNPMSDYLARTVWEWAIYAKPAAPSIAQDGQKSEADHG